MTGEVEDLARAAVQGARKVAERYGVSTVKLTAVDSRSVDCLLYSTVFSVNAEPVSVSWAAEQYEYRRHVIPVGRLKVEVQLQRLGRF